MGFLVFFGCTELYFFSKTDLVVNLLMQLVFGEGRKEKPRDGKWNFNNKVSFHNLSDKKLDTLKYEVFLILVPSLG
jgi:hypothetical protein